MTTRFPDNLPAVDLPGRWNHDVDFTRGEISDDHTVASSLNLIDARDGEEAERRTLAVVSHDYQDNLRGGWAEAVKEIAPDRWEVRVFVRGEF